MILDNFESIGKSKLEIASRLTRDEELAKCLINCQTDFLNYPVTKEAQGNLLYTQIFPYNTIQGLQNKAKSYITMKFKFSRVKGANVFKDSVITFYLFCEDSLVKTDYGYLRYDFMLQRIAKLFNDSKSDQWLGKMLCDDVDDTIVDPSGKYIGTIARFVYTEFV